MTDNTNGEMNELQPSQLQPRLANFLKGIDLQNLSRVPSSRLKETALPNIGLLELVCGDDFEQDYQPIYVTMFASNERERPELIIARLEDEFADRRPGLAPYRVIGVRDPSGAAIGAAQFSVLMLSGGKFAIPYLQYIYVRKENRRQDISEVLHTLVLAIAVADARCRGDNRTVPFTLFETEPPNHGSSLSNQANATERVKIHAKSGSKALMLVDGTGKACSAHVQPGLDHGDKPVTLMWATRASPGISSEDSFDANELGAELLAGYYQSMRDEGFPEENIAFAENLAKARCEGSHFVEMPLADVTAAMYQNLEADGN